MSPIFVFPMFIGVVTFFANFRLWGLPSASSIVYLMILCGVVFFALGGSLVKPVATHSKVKYTYKTKHSQNKHCRINPRSDIICQPA